MKKLIAISVVFALVAGAAFAVDVTGTVFGHVNVLQGDTGKDKNGDSNPVTASGGMDRIRIDGSGESGDGDFGGYIRAQGNNFTIDSAYAWWKPIDQFKLIIGGFSDGFWGKEGVTGWSFNQMPNDSSVALNYGIWCGPGWGSSIFGGTAYYHNRYTFFEGFQYFGASLEITPMDMLAINIGIPFIDTPRASYGKNAAGDPDPDADLVVAAADVFIASVFQLNLNLDFGNIAITYDGSNRAGMKAQDGGTIFAYFGGSFGDLGIDFGVGYHLSGDAKNKPGQTEASLPIGIGVGVKYATDSFGVKFRTTATVSGEETDPMVINATVLPFFTLSDSMAAFVNVGLCMTMPNEGDSVTGWFFNPYLRVGAEWGPTFYAGIQVSSDGIKNAEDKTVINWAVPIALMVSF